jgi:hypothetical protein
MNTKTHALSTTQVNDTELRELSYVEQAEVSGGMRACYKNKSGYNPTRYVFRNGTVYYQVARRGRYVTQETHGDGRIHVRDFTSVCRKQGYNTIR